MNIKLTLSFEGTSYHGWQVQENAVTVCGTLHSAVRQIMSDVEEIQGISRTDAGVHALEYICNFHTQKPIPIDRVATALNSILPEDIRVLGAEECAQDFNSRFDCDSKTYIYRINNAKIASPFERSYSYHFPYEMNLDRMREAAKFICGEHDFSCFCASGEERENHVRKVNSLEVDKDGDIITIRINANAYLYNMVRIIAGTLAEVGNGKILPEKILDIIESRDRTKAGRTAPAKGLFLEKCWY